MYRFCLKNKTFLFQFALSQCIGREVIGNGLGGSFGWPYEGPYDGFGIGAGWPAAGCGLGSLAPLSGLAASCGGGLTVTSSSPIAPTGLTVNSENAIEGTVAVVGQLPFLGAVATDGSFATAGAGAVTYGCGDGAVGIVAEVPIAPGVGPAAGGLGYGPGPGPYGFGPMVGYNPNAPLGCGCGKY